MFVITFLITLLSILALILLIIFSTRHFNHWKKKGVPYDLKSVPIFGSFFNVMTLNTSIGDALMKFHLEIKEPFYGLFLCDEPALLVRDPNLIKSILVKDFGHFIDRTMANNFKDDPMGSHVLFVVKNPIWRELRRKMTPAFTTGKMKLMYDLICQSSGDLVEYLQKNVVKCPIVDVREVTAKYTTDAITSTSFGINANCFINEDAEFRQVSRRIFNWAIIERGISTMCYFVVPRLVPILGLRFLDKKSTTFLRDAFWQTMKEREESKVVRNDLLDILIEMRKAESIDDPYKLEGDRLVAQATQFFMAGFETTSTTITFALYELARNQEIQQKLRNEIKKVHEKFGGFTYDSLKEMKYLEMCIEETLRMYPALPFLDRRCTKDYQIPDSNIVIDKGTRVFISSMGLQYEDQYFPEPHKFIPERFSEEQRVNIQPFTYLPFGEGPRNCIGARFGRVSSKSGLGHIILNFQIDLCDETELIFHNKGFLLAPKNELKLKFTKL